MDIISCYVILCNRRYYLRGESVNNKDITYSLLHDKQDHDHDLEVTENDEDNERKIVECTEKISSTSKSKNKLKSSSKILENK